MYTRNVNVQPSDVSCRGAIKLRSLLDYFQNTAGLAVENLEGTTSELIAKGYAWVLTRYEIEVIDKLPGIDEKFIINTFHDPSHGYNTLRVFDVRDTNGKPSAWAKSSWLLLDLANGRPVKAAAHIPNINERDTEIIDPNFREIKYNGEEIIKSVEFPVRFHDLDYNSHVNNAVYFGWVCDECPVDLMNFELKSICASFRTGAKLGEKVTLNYSHVSNDENIFLCTIHRENVTKPSAEFILEWQEAK